MSIEHGLITTLLDQVRTGHVQVASEGVASEGVAPDGFVSDAPVSDDRGDIETPFLQLVLTRLWDQERATGSSLLRQSTLEELGGAQTIVQSHLDNVMAGLSPAQIDVAAAVFHHLVTTSGMKIALTAEDLAEWSGRPVSAVQDLFKTLGSGPHRILRPVPPAVGIDGPPRYEIFHDVMGAAVLDWRRRYVAQQQQAEASRRLIAERDEARAVAQAARRERDLIAEREEARAAAQATRRKLRRTRLTVILAVMLLLAISVFAIQNHRNSIRQTYLEQAATALGYNPVESLKRAVHAYQMVDIPWLGNANKQARAAILTAASSPRSQVVAGPNPMMIGMHSTPDSRHAVAYDRDGSIRVIGDNGAVQREVKATDLRGTVTPAAAAVNPDASRIALGTDQGTVAVIDTLTGRHIDIESEGGLPRAVKWIGSTANGLVLVVSGTGVATTHDPETGKQVARFPGVVYDALPLADEQHIVTSGQDRKLRVWDAQTGTNIAESSTLDPAVHALRRYAQSVVSFSLSGVSLGVKPSIVVWNWQTGSDPVRYSIDGFNDIRQVVVNERAQTVIISQGKEVRTYNLVDGSLLGSLPQQSDFVTDVATSPDGQWITTASNYGRVLVWSARHRQPPTAPTYEFLAHRATVTQLSYLQDGQVVMSLSRDGTVRRWELPQVPRLQQHDNWVVDMDLSRDGTWLATASQDGRAFIIDPHDLSTPPAVTVSTDAPLRAVLLDPTQPHRILTLDRTARFPKLWSWDYDGNSERLHQYDPPPLPTNGYLASLAISPNGKTVASGDTRGTIHLWDATTGALRTDRQFPGAGQPATSVTFDPTGQLLAATDSGRVHLWDLGTTDPPTLLSHPYATSVTFDPSGQHLVSTDHDGTVNIWTRDGKLDRELVAHGRLSSSPAFSEDGGLLAVGTLEGLVQVWDVRSGVTVMLDRHHSAPVNNVRFLPGDRSRLISASDDTTVAQFSCPACADPDRVIQEAMEWAGAN
jgi:WD40 repeat protein